ncbi:uncharacterized protein LOC144358428 [Saccoglossus kowalevskii]
MTEGVGCLGRTLRRKLTLPVFFLATVCLAVCYMFAAMYVVGLQSLNKVQRCENTQNKITPTPAMCLNEISVRNPCKVSLLRRNVTGDSTKQGALYGNLKPHDKMVVPNIAHFIWFTCHKFRFENLISILSVHRSMRPERILFHTDCEPDNKWWFQAKQLIPVLEVINRTAPTTVFNHTLNPKWPEHSADIARLQILIEMGSVYFDTDVIVLAPLEPLRHYDYVAAKPSQDVVSNGIIFAEKNSRFLRYFYNSYKNYIKSCWGCSSVRMQNKLAKSHWDLLHIEPTSLIGPPWNQWQKILLEKYDWQDERFSIHVFLRKYRRRNLDYDFTAENIRYLNTTFGEMCRYIYYGSPALIH